MTALDAPPPPPALESLDDLRTYLWQVHQVTVSADDPLLMTYTVHKVALNEIARLLDHYERALSDNVKATGETFTDDVTAAIERFQAEALTDTVRERLAAMQEAARLSDASQIQFRRLIRVLTGLTLVNLVAALVSLGVLATLVQ